MKNSKSRNVFRVVNGIFLLFLSLVCCYPLLYVLFASFSEPHRLLAHDGFLFSPLGFTLKGYELVLKSGDIYSGYFNTIIYVIVGSAVSVTLTLLGGYCLSRKKFLWRGAIMKFIMLTMFLSGGMIPTFLVVQNLGLIDTRLSMILPTAISTYNLIIMRTSIEGVSESLIEAAKIDGAKDFTILFKIVVPVVMPTLAVMVLFYAFAKWNSWFEPMVYLRSRNLFPLQTILRELLVTNDLKEVSDEAMMKSAADMDLNKELLQYSTVVLATLPMLLIYPFLQKYFTKGVMVGAVKE